MKNNCKYIQEFLTDIESILEEIEKLDYGKYTKFFKAYFSVNNVLKIYSKKGVIPEEVAIIYLFLEENGKFSYEFNRDLLEIIEDCIELN